MMFKALIISVLFILCACQNENTPYSTDEYVLIEFAAKLEEDYPKLYPIEDATADNANQVHP